MEVEDVRTASELIKSDMFIAYIEIGVIRPMRFNLGNQYVKLI